jgi:predicted GIY-YIG superfamily endonuclease
MSKRLHRHNSGGNASTAHRKPFVLIHVEQFENKSKALKRELFLKSVEGHTKLKDFLKSNLF